MIYFSYHIKLTKLTYTFNVLISKIKENKMNKEKHIEKKKIIHNYTQSAVNNAIIDIKNGSSILGTSKKYGIPRSTLNDKLKGKVPIEKKMGPPTILSSEEEDILVKWVVHCAESGFPVTKYQQLDSVQKLVENKIKIHHSITTVRVDIGTNHL